MIRPLPDEILALPHRRDVPFAKLTTMGLGGLCRWLFEPVDEDQAQVFIRTCAKEGLPYRVLGAGSNLVVLSDIEDPVLRLRFPAEAQRDGTRISAPASLGFIRLSEFAAESGLSGLEWACGIPGSCGGALRMNAGAGGRETLDLLRRFRFLTPDGERVERRPEPGDFRYRWSFLMEGHVALGFDVNLTTGDNATIRAEMANLKALRLSTQPIGHRSAGCTFKNPAGDKAGRLIEATGLKGLRVGNIEVSERHANFLLNLGHGTSSEWAELVARIQERVKEAQGIDLELEVEVWRP